MDNPKIVNDKIIFTNKPRLMLASKIILAITVVVLYVTQYFVAGYSISWLSAIIGAIIYGIVDYFLPSPS